jgi:hypothetical protein
VIVVMLPRLSKSIFRYEVSAMRSSFDFVGDRRHAGCENAERSLAPSMRA